MKKKKYKSSWNNFIYSLKSIFSASAIYPVLKITAIFVILASSVYATYENKLLLDVLDSGNPIIKIVFIICGIIGIYLISNIINNLFERSLAHFGNKVEKKLYLRAVKTICRADYDKVDDPQYKNLYSQYINYVQHSILGLFNSNIDIIYSILSIFVFGTMISMLHPFIAIGLVVMAIVHFLVKKPLVKLNQKMNIQVVANNRKFQYVTDISNDFANAKEVRLYNMNGWIKNITNDCMMEHKRIYSKLQWATFFVGLCHRGLDLLRDGFAYIYLIVLFSKGEMTPGNFVLYFTAITRLSKILTAFSEKFNEVNKYTLEVDALRKTEEINSQQNHGEGMTIEKERAEIEFRNVSFRYPLAENDTIKNINFTISSHEKLAIVGINGAGKTTLVKLICGLYRPTKGEILFNGHPISDYNIYDYYSQFSAVFQEINIMPYSIAENVACAIDKSKIDRKKVYEALEKAGIAEKVRTLPNGIDTCFDKEINESAVDFSGGERQKFALARAIYMGRPVLILDEPTSALDPIAENDMYLRFNEITENVTSIFISHRLASTRFCDKILHIENGTIIEQGSHEQLMQENGVYADMFRIQSKYYSDERKCESNEKKKSDE